MNLCIIVGKLIEEVEFKFLYEDKRISIAYVCIELRNKATIKIKGYTENADKMYQELTKGDFVFLEGKIDSKMEIEINWIQKIE